MEVQMTCSFEKFRSHFSEEFIVFSDFIAPKLGVYEQTVYLFLLRQCFAAETFEINIGIKSCRFRMGFGAGNSKKPMSETTATKQVASLNEKGLLIHLGSDRFGTRLEIIPPTSSKGFIPESLDKTPPNPVEFDCFNDTANRRAIVKRENGRCFYCLSALDTANTVMEHVVSRPDGGNSYLNIVASCRSCNNKKNSSDAEDFLRTLFRSNLIDESELADRFIELKNLRLGLLVPDFGQS